MPSPRWGRKDRDVPRPAGKPACRRDRGDAVRHRRAGRRHHVGGHAGSRPRPGGGGTGRAARQARRRRARRAVARGGGRMAPVHPSGVPRAHREVRQGSILGISSIVVCMLSQKSIPLAIIGGIVSGAAIGALNGYFYVFRKIKSFIVTICTMFLFRGFIKYLTTNAPVAGSAKLINYDSTELKIACTVVILLIGFVAFRYTKFGTYLKAIGAGEKAAMFSGIRTDKMKFLIYVLAGAITGFAAFINVIKVGSVTSSGGNQLETQILIALVLGGMPISGGAKVRFENIIVGSLLYVVLNSGLTMMGFSTQMMQLIQGIVFLIFVAVFADRESIQVIK